MKQNGFMLFGDQRRLLSVMTSEQKAALLESLYAYNDGEDAVPDDPVVKMAFWIISSSIDRVKNHSETKQRAGMAGGQRSALRRQAKRLQAKPRQVQAEAKQIQAEPKQTQALNVNGNMNENVNGNVEGREEGEAPQAPRACGSSSSTDGDACPPGEAGTNPRAKGASPRAKGMVQGAAFSSPSPEEVAAYCAERQNSVDATRFCDYYAAQGWRLSNGRQMRDWKAAVRNWEARERASPRVSPQGGQALQARTVAEKQYLEREERAKALLAVNMQRQHDEIALEGTDGGADLPPGYSLPPHWHQHG